MGASWWHTVKVAWKGTCSHHEKKKSVTYLYWLASRNLGFVCFWHQCTFCWTPSSYSVLLVSCGFCTFNFENRSDQVCLSSGMGWTLVSWNVWTKWPRQLWIWDADEICSAERLGPNVLAVGKHWNDSTPRRLSLTFLFSWCIIFATSFLVQPFALQFCFDTELQTSLVLSTVKIIMLLLWCVFYSWLVQMVPNGFVDQKSVLVCII